MALKPTDIQPSKAQELTLPDAIRLRRAYDQWQIAEAQADKARQAYNTLLLGMSKTYTNGAIARVVGTSRQWVSHLLRKLGDHDA